MFWQNCFSVHLNFLFPSLGSGSLSNYSWEVNKYLVSCQTQEVLQIGNCFFSAEILVLIAIFSWIFLLCSKRSLVFKLSSHLHNHDSHTLHDTMFMTHDPWCEHDTVFTCPESPSDWQHPRDGPGHWRWFVGRRESDPWHGETVQWTVHCSTHLYSVLLTVQFKPDH